MSKTKYEVIRPWVGVTQGQVLELDPDKLHPSLRANLRKISAAGVTGGDTEQAQEIISKAKEEAEMFLEEARRKFDEVRENAKAEAEKIIKDAKAEAERIKVEATGQGVELTVNPADRRELIKAKLAELGIEFDGRQGEAALFKLLPQEEQNKLGE